MFCPQCEMEIKGDDQTECPICGSALIDNPFEGSFESADGASEDLKLKELIDDIEQKVSGEGDDGPDEAMFTLDGDDGPDDRTVEDVFRLDDTQTLEADPTMSEFQLDGIDVGDSHSGEEFNLDLDEGERTSGVEEPPVQDSAVPDEHDSEREDPAALFPDDGNLAEEEESVAARPEELSEPYDERADMDEIEDERTEAADISELEEPVASEAGEKQMPEAEPEIPDVDFVDDREPEQEAVPEEAAADTPAELEEISTKELLDKAIDELEAVSPAATGRQGQDSASSSRLPLALVVLLLIVVGGGAFYYFSVMKKSGAEKTTVPTVTMKEKVTEVIPEPEVRPAGSQAPAVQEAPPAPPLPVEPAPPYGETPPEMVPKAASAPASPEPEKPAFVGETAPPAPEPVLEAAPVAPVPVPKAVTPPAVPVGRYAIHAGSFKKEAVAMAEARRFQEKGYVTDVQRADLGAKGVWYRIKVGRYATKSEAQKAQKEFASKFKSPSRVVKISQ